jgi:hypothetical protein
MANSDRFSSELLNKEFPLIDKVSEKKFSIDAKRFS